MDKQSLIKALSRFPEPEMGSRTTSFTTVRLSVEDAPHLVDLITEPREPRTATQWVALYAWRALKSLGTPVDVTPLLKALEHYQDNPWALDELPSVIAQAGERAVLPTLHYLQDETVSELPRGIAVRILSQLVLQHANLRSQIVDHLSALLATHTMATPELNGFIVLALVELKAIESLVVLNKAYQAGKVSEAVAGDWEDVEIALGLRTERSTPRQGMETPEAGDIPPPSQAPVLDTISNDELFSRLQEHLDYYATEHSIQEVAGLDGLFTALACSPQMIMPTEWLAAIWGGEEAMPEFSSQAELTIFIELLMKLFNQSHQHVKETNAFIASFMTNYDEAGNADLDVVSWCEGFMRGVVLGQHPLIEIPNMPNLLTPIALFGSESGYAKAKKMRDSEIQTWARQIEPSVLKIRDWAQKQASKPKTITQEAKTGRNDPCPCGSGKKYKKCCGV